MKMLKAFKLRMKKAKFMVDMEVKMENKRIHMTT